MSSPGAVHRRVEGTLLFVDVSGFTALTERLADARKGRRRRDHRHNRVGLHRDARRRRLLRSGPAQVGRRRFTAVLPGTGLAIAGVPGRRFDVGDDGPDRPVENFRRARHPRCVDRRPQRRLRPLPVREPPPRASRHRAGRHRDRSHGGNRRGWRGARQHCHGEPPPQRRPRRTQARGDAPAKSARGRASANPPRCASQQVSMLLHCCRPRPEPASSAAASRPNIARRRSPSSSSPGSTPSR